MNGTLSPSTKFGRPVRLALIALVAFAGMTTAHSAHARGNSGMCCCGSLPELWLINTRCAPRCNNLDRGFERISYQRYDRCSGCFVRETRESFLAGEATMPTLFYIHGNSLKHKGAMKGFWQVYDKLRCCPGKKRLVCWSWPAERVYKTEGLRVREMIRKNLRIKFVYAEYQGYYLAKLVDQMSLTQRVTLSGHSYGAITSAVALHLMGGGCVRGMTFANGAPVERPNLRAAMISAAFDCDMLYPGHRYGQSFVTAERILSTFNCHDKTLKKWPRTSWRGYEALGYAGMNGGRLGQYRHKFCQLNTYPENGRSHYLGPHLKNPRFVSAYCCIAFGGIHVGVPTTASTINLDAELTEAAEEQAVTKKSVKRAISPAVKKEEEPTLAEPVSEKNKEVATQSGQEARAAAPRKSAQQSTHSVKAVSKKTGGSSGNRTSHLRRRNGVLGSRG
jgi:pimeloyl-ACP methyl ester carboxylesterase